MSGVEKDPTPNVRETTTMEEEESIELPAPTANVDTTAPLKVDDIVKISIALSPDEPPPSAFDLFYQNFDVEMARVPTHFRMQRWSKRRIANRWKWITSREREAYEKKAELLKQDWLALRETQGKTKSKISVPKTKQIAPAEVEKKTVRSTEARQDGKRKRERAKEKLIKLIAAGESFEESDERALKNAPKMSKEDSLLFHGLDDKKQRRNKRKKRTRQLSPIHIEDFLSDANKTGQASHPNSIAPKPTDPRPSDNTKSLNPTSSSTPPTTWTQPNHDVPAINAIQRQQFHRHQQVIEREIAATHGPKCEEQDETGSIQSGASTVGSSSGTSSSSSVSSVPLTLDPRVKSQTRPPPDPTRRQQSTSRGSRAQWSRSKPCQDGDDGSPSDGSTPLLESATSSASSSIGSSIPPSGRERERHRDVQPRLNDSPSPPRQAMARIREPCDERMVISQRPRFSEQPTILDHISFRKKCSSEIQSGSTAFPCIPCTSNYTHTILFSSDASREILGLNSGIDKHYEMSPSFLLDEMRDFCAFEFGLINAVLIHERREDDVGTPCSLFVMIQFPSRDCAFNAHTRCTAKTDHRLDFVEVWFSCAYFARQSYSRSNLGSHCLVNCKKGGVSCQCETHPSHAHSSCAHVNPDLEETNVYDALNEFEPCSSPDCIMFCCCSLHRKRVDTFTYYDIHVGDVVLWRGTKCLVEFLLSEHEIGITTETKCERHVVPSASLTKVVSFSYNDNRPHGSKNGSASSLDSSRSMTSSSKERNVETMSDLDETFDSHAQLVDGLTVTEFFRNFWLTQGNLGRCKLLFG